MNILSPLTKTNNVFLERKIDKKKIIEAYLDYKIDVSPYFNKVEHVSVYKCNETGYRFYHEFNLSGDSSFYEHFQQFDWYYMPWKWEHEITKEYILPNNSILEVGCAHGSFIKKINELFPLQNTVGLELNETAITKTDKWEIKNETVQSFSLKNTESFDLVCSFQVLEHISDVHSFIQSSVACLKKGGKLIISVPNNNASFIKSGENCLNMPPHHMGLWDEHSLRSLETIFPLKVINVHFEELQEYHLPGYVQSVYYANYSKFTGKVIRKLHKFIGIYENRIKKARANRHQIVGHTILIAYEKL